MPKKEISNNKTKEVKTKEPKKSNTKSNTKNVSGNTKKVTSPKKVNKIKKEVKRIDKKATKVESKKIETKVAKKATKSAPKKNEIKESEATKKVKERTAKLAKAISEAEKKVSNKSKEIVTKNSKADAENKEMKLLKSDKREKETKIKDKKNEKLVTNEEVIATDKKNAKTVEERLDKEDLAVVVKKENSKVDEETVIEKIKSFIAKIAAMQEEASKEENATKDKKEKVKQVTEKVKETKKAAYMLEYYDLPYRYNETVVKILAQTPKMLFVYWDIADSDRNKYIETFGADFFEKTYPVLLLYNEDRKYVKEVPVNDFANSWYIDIEDSKTKYIIQLGRKFKGNDYNYVNTEKVQNANIILKTDYLPFANSNMLEAPNDHVLLESLPDFLIFRNVKTNQEFTKDIRDFGDVYGNGYDVRKFYNDQYKEEITDGIFDMANPSSNLSSSSFR